MQRQLSAVVWGATEFAVATMKISIAKCLGPVTHWLEPMTVGGLTQPPLHQAGTEYIVNKINTQVRRHVTAQKGQIRGNLRDRATI
jgi:hypothetical protein